MWSFQSWLKEEARKSKRKDRKNGDKSNHQGSGAFGDVNHEGEANGFNQEILEPDIHFFPEP
jgi:hypothetical protein